MIRPIAMPVHCACVIPVSQQVADIFSDKPLLTIQGHDPHRAVVENFHYFIHVLLLQSVAGVTSLVVMEPIVFFRK
jgi:hypothetical protein